VAWAVPYLIDGYNLARASSQFQGGSSPESDVVVRFLNRVARLKKTKITVVFDGYPPNWNQSQSLSQSFDVVKILFTGPESNADTKIRRMIGSTQNRKGWTVVSSDHAVYGYARVSGVKALRSDEFLQQANQLIGSASKEVIDIPQDEVDYWLRVFEGKDKGSRN
jgi:predicted RNA-binding protein with PIN domain